MFFYESVPSFPPLAFFADAMLLVATTAFTPPQAPSVLRHRARVSMSGVDLGQTFRRAEVWSSDTATLADVINVVGRWESCSEWRERTEFREDVEKDKLLFFEDPVQPYTRAKYEMSVRLGSASRVRVRARARARARVRVRVRVRAAPRRVKFEDGQPPPARARSERGLEVFKREHGRHAVGGRGGGAGHRLARLRELCQLLLRERRASRVTAEELRRRAARHAEHGAPRRRGRES